MTTPLIVVQPVAITSAMLISSDVPETDHAAWSGATNYGLGVRVISTTTHKIYESLQAGNLNHDPTLTASAAWWIEVGPTNRWKLFDTSNSTQTAQSTAMSYTIRPASGVNALAALNVTGVTTIRVRVTHPTLGTIYDKTTALASLPPAPEWWSWFYGIRTAPPLMVATDLPGVPGCDVIADFTGTTALAVGVLMVGAQRAIGISVTQGARVGIQDYSRKETNTFGDVVLSQRAFAKRASFDIPILSPRRR